MKRSVIWKIDKQELITLVSNSNSLSEVLRSLEISPKGGNSKTLKLRLIEDNIEIPFTLGINSNKGKTFVNTSKIPLDKILVENSTYSRGHLKSRLLKENILIEECSNCQLKPFWNNKKLVLVLDHINGISNDHRLKNLRLLCPNCNSQTETFAGKNKKYTLVSPEKYIKASLTEKHYKIQRECTKCGARCSKNKYNLCVKCYGLLNRKVERPSIKQIKEDVIKLGYSGTGRKYKVSDNAIRKWLKSKDITE